jgi:hypothetical protein
MNMAGFGGETRGHFQNGVKDYRSKGHRRVSLLRLGVIFIERDVTILEAHQKVHDSNHLMGHAERWGSLKDSVLTQHLGLMVEHSDCANFPAISSRSDWRFASIRLNACIHSWAFSCSIYQRDLDKAEV